MKRKFLILILISLAVSSYVGGDKKPKGFHPKIKFGAEAGLNLAKIIYQNPNSFPSDFTLQWHAGVYADITFNDKLTFQPELLYFVTGTTITKFNPTYKVHLNYIEIPLQLKYNIGNGFSIFGGPYIAIFISQSNNIATTVYSNSESPQSAIRTLDLGTVIGIEHQWANGFNIGVKYNQGFYDIVMPGLIPENNLVFSLYVGWTFLKF
jgi:hypothetical protein